MAADSLLAAGGVAAANDDEEITLWTGTYSWQGMAHEVGLALLATIFLLLAGSQVFADKASRQVAWSVVGLTWFVLVCVLLVRKLAVRYEITNQRLIHKRGIFRRSVNRIEAIDIDDVGVEQNLLERILGAGQVWIRSSDQSHPRMRMGGIASVHRVSELIDETRRRERLRRGVYVETI